MINRKEATNKAVIQRDKSKFDVEYILVDAKS